MSNALDHEQQQQILALGRLGWTVSRIATATGVRHETVTRYVRAACRSPKPRTPFNRVIPGEPRALPWVMLARLLRVLRQLTVLAGGHRALALENLALRQQLAMYRRTRPRPTVRWPDRLF